MVRSKSIRGLMKTATSIYTNHGVKRTVRMGLNFILLETLGHSNNPEKHIRLLLRYYSKLPNKQVTSADMFKIIHLSPEKIQKYGHHPIPKFWGLVIGGSWDRDLNNIEDRSLYESLKLRFEHRSDWEETPMYQKHMKKLTQNGVVEGAENVNELNKRYSDIDELYTSIKKNGLKSQRELLENKDENITSETDDSYHPILNEIGVNIGRNGEFIHRARGTHRLIIAKILGLESVPVCVRVRHSQWEDIRERKIRNSKIDPELKNHPDLMDTNDDFDS